MLRNRQGHSTTDQNTTADECTKKSGEAFVKNDHDTDEKSLAYPCAVKTMPTATITKSLMKNNERNLRLLTKPNRPSATVSANNRALCDMKEKYKNGSTDKNCNGPLLSVEQHRISTPVTKSDFINNVNKIVSSTSDSTNVYNLFATDSQNVDETCHIDLKTSNLVLKQNSAFLNGDVERQQSELCSQMSGLAPDVTPSSAYFSETHQLNYRLSTSITETKTNLANELPTVIQNSECEEDQKNCRLPSSVYGASPSNIEKLLTGLQFTTSKGTVENSKVSCIQSCFSQKGNDKELLKDSIISRSHSSSNTIVRNDSFSSLKLQKDYDRKTEDTGNSDFQSDNQLENQSKLKIYIPEAPSPEDSDQSIPETLKPIKFPKITSPQILEQHISKIISDNAAIVDTLNPLWTKRFLRQSSSNSSQSSDSETRRMSFSNKSRRMSEDRTNLPVSVDSNQSKLQSALLGTLEPKQVSGSQDAGGASHVPFPSRTISFSVTSSSTLPPKQMSTVTEEELKGSAIKSLLSLKQATLPDNNTFSFDKDIKFDQHPQNPEGSIIKDLLLKSKSKTKFGTYADGEQQTLFGASSLAEPIHVCTCCGLKFLSPGVLEAHKTVCKGFKSNIATPKSGKDDKALSTQLRAETVDKVPLSFPILNPLALSNSIEVLLKNENSGDEGSDDIGYILKKQLLAPLNNKNEPVLKKRKISEPLIFTNKLTTFDLQKSENTFDFQTGISTGLPLESSLHRSRSQSMHLFGGEVRLREGTKKMKISSCLSETTPSTTNSVLTTLSHTKSSLYEQQEKKGNISLQTVVIAQPVHNSGGTVIHVPAQKAHTSLSPLMNFQSQALSADKIEERHLEHLNTSKTWEALFSSPDIKPSTDISNSTKLSVEKSVIQKNTFIGKVIVKESQRSQPLFSSTNVIKPVTSFSIMSDRESTTSSIFTVSKPNMCTFSGNAFLPVKSAASYSSNIGKTIDSTPEVSVSSKSAFKSEITKFQFSDSPNKSRSVVPTLLLTPSSPPHSITDEKRDESDEDGARSRKLLAPIRPNSLPLKKKPFTMVGSTLISPETPRPKKNCVQLYINGHAYTYLGLKCSTRSTYCCIYRPQPMFVLQETDPKLSMYSNWQVVPAKEELAGLTPGQLISLYNSKQPSSGSEMLSTTARTGELLSFTHSSYWSFRSQERDKNDSESMMSLEKSFPSYPSVMDLDCSDNTTSDFLKTSYGSRGADSFLCNESIQIGNKDGRTSSISDNTSSLDVEASLSDADVTNSQDEDDDDDDERTDVLTDSSQSQAPKRVKIFEGGFKSNEDYTYVRGRGRGKYVCEECGIRCKKPSMLKKHIRTHTDLRPYKCRHCSFAFKTKGNLTKHMKSKAHHKKCTELGIIPVPTTTDDSQIDQEALAKQERLKKRNLPFSDGESADEDDDDEDQDEEFDDSDGLDEDYESDNSSCAMSINMNNNMASGNLQESEPSVNVASGLMTELVTVNTQESLLQRTVEQEAARSLLHLSSLNDMSDHWPPSPGESLTMVTGVEMAPNISCLASISPVSSTSVTSSCVSPVVSHKALELSSFLSVPDETIGHRPRSYSADVPFGGGREQLVRQQQSTRTVYALLENAATREGTDSMTKDVNPRRYSISVAREARKARAQTLHWGIGTNSNVEPQKWPEMETAEQPMDLTVSRNVIAVTGKPDYHATLNSINPLSPSHEAVNVLNSEIYLNESFAVKPPTLLSSQLLNEYDSVAENNTNFTATISLQDSSPCSIHSNVPQHPVFYTADGDVGSIPLGRKEGDLSDNLPSPEMQEYSICSPVSPLNLDENSYTVEGVGPSPSFTETLQTRSQSQSDYMKAGTSNMEEGKCVCRICNKIFAKAGQLRIHVNIHYFERPFRCDNCGVSFRTKGHLQKHKRSVSHYNKVNMNMTFGTPSVDNPRPFKCADCKIAFRIHGHLAKHLRSKMHIMKLECLGKLPFGMYAEMERSGISLNEIDTTDCNNSLESLQVMAQKLYQRDPRRMRWHSPTPPHSEFETSNCSVPRAVDNVVSPVPDQLTTTHSSPSAIATPVPSTVNLNIPIESPGDDVKNEPSDVIAFAPAPSFPEVELSPKTVLFTNQNIAAPAYQPIARAEAAENESHTSLHRSDTCHICGRMFKSTKFLQVHLYCDHSSWNPSAGEIPTSPVVTRDSISTTSGAVPVTVQEVLACDLCGKHFSNQNSLQQHLLTHAQPRPFVCEICDAGFTSSTSLVAHLATHQQINSSTAASTEASLLQLQ